ncbi:MAG: IS4 family transposase, partial [Deltaproteobacteria bacterium]|nr:IS4 family transposase [Deltaproteobacteria bacterium]
VLSMVMRRLGDDWQERYGYRPVLVETFVDPKRFKGSCYLAANWISLGTTAGRPTAFPNGKVSDGPKEIFVYPLCGEWRSVLCQDPLEPLGAKPRPESFSDWAGEEFYSIQVYDNRLKAKLCAIARDFFAQPGAPIPQALQGSGARIKGAYRFFDNKRVTMEDILRAHKESTIERIKSHSLVLAVQDTTTLNYTSHHSTEGLGPIGTKEDSSQGLIVHDTVAFTAQGTPLGLLDVQCWARDPEQAGKKYRRKELGIEEKESNKWLKSYGAASEVQSVCPDTTLVSIGDREADIYELFYEAQHTLAGAKLLICAERSRGRKVKAEGEEGVYRLWDKMSQVEPSGEVIVSIPQRANRKALDARLEVRHDSIELLAPRGKDLPSLSLWAVYAVEVDYAPDVKEPLEWMLL